jgi:hypothetical protein
MSLSPGGTAAALEWALRVVLASALIIHSILDISDLFHGAKSHFLQIEGSIPRWMLPTIGILRAVAAFALFADNDNFVLGALLFSSALWSGAMFFHVRRKHHPAAVLPASLFVLLVAVITALRVNLLVALGGTALCAVAGVGLGCILVTPAQEGKEARAVRLI